MHAIVMVHKMQSMTLSNHQLIPTKAESPSGDQGTSADSASLQCDSSEQAAEESGAE